MTKLMIGAALGALLLPATAIADTAPRERVSVAVSTAGLDLATPRGVRSLEGRMSRAIALACSPEDRVTTSYSPDWQCRDELSNSADTKLAAIRRMGPGGYASVVTLESGLN